MIISLLGYMMAGMIIGYIANAIIRNNIYIWLALMILVLIWNIYL